MNHKPVEFHSPKTIQANYPKHPRHRKPFRVSYFFENELINHRALLRVEQVLAWDADDAKKAVAKEGRHILSAYKASGMPPLKGKPRHVFLNKDKQVIAKPKRYKFPIPLCKFCKKGLLRWQRVCSDPACRDIKRRIKNVRQLQSKKERIFRAKQRGRLNPCNACVTRDAKPGRTHCEHCLSYKKTQKAVLN